MKKPIYFSILLFPVVIMLFSTCTHKADNIDPAAIPGQVSDIDGNIYTTITIGTQV